MQILYSAPEYFLDIFERLVERKWLIHNFPNLDDNMEYDFSGYLYNREVNQVEYTICLDVNVYQFLLNSTKKHTPKQEYKDAIGLVLFCQIAKIELDPTLAVYEKLNYENNPNKLSEITHDLELFHRINNTSNEQLVRYFYGELERVIPDNLYEIDHSSIQENLTRYERLTDWDSLYVIIQYIVYISLHTNKKREEKLKNVIEWMITDFRLSLVCITYASVFFSKKPIKRMMKYKHTDTALIRKQALYNMTWDLYAMNKYFQDWTKRKGEQECLYASDDKAFRHLLRSAVDIQNSGSLEPLLCYLDESELKYINKITKDPSEFPERIYRKENWTIEYRQSLIADLNNKLDIAYI